MARYIFNRILSGLFTMFKFVTLLFLLASAVTPGDFVISLGPMRRVELRSVLLPRVSAELDMA